MDPIMNPFSPGAGAPPPELVGRGPLLEEARILLGRIKQKRPEKSLLLTGLRGVGKTVLLNEIERQARAAGYHTIVLEAHENKPLGPLLAPYLRTVLYELDRIAGAGHKVKRGLRVLRSFLGALRLTYAGVELGLDIEPEHGSSDSRSARCQSPTRQGRCEIPPVQQESNSERKHSQRCSA
jgi:AAA ATPase-like protein